MPRASYEMSKYAALCAVADAPVEVVRTPQGSPAQRRWNRNRTAYQVPLNSMIRARLVLDGFLAWVDPDEEAVQRTRLGPKVKITDAGRAEHDRIAAALANA